MAEIIWLDEFVFYLIERVQKTNYVWNPQNLSYKNKRKRRWFWLQLVEDMNREFNPNTPFTYEVLPKKWKYMMAYYKIGTQRIRALQRSDASVEKLEDIKSNWKYLPLLEFLSANNSTLTNKTENMKSSISSSEDNSVPNYSAQLTEFIELAYRSLQPTLKSPNYLRNENFAEDATNSTKEIISQDTESFTDSIKAEIYKLDADLQSTAKKQIFTIIMDLQLEQLNRKMKVLIN